MDKESLDEKDEMVVPESESLETEAVEAENSEASSGEKDIESLQELIKERDAALEKEKNEYLFLMAEFDNFKRRTAKEKAEIIRNGGESVIKGLLPILDDFERGLASIKDSSDVESVKEGMELIYNKFVKYLEQNGVKEIETAGADFNDDFHEAIALVPVPDESLKGKIIDTMTKGYTLNGKVIRHAKVAVGQ